jgi:hypothetical protein
MIGKGGKGARRALVPAIGDTQEMLHPIDDANLGQALDLLVKGFPRGSRHFWEQGVQRVARYNAWHGATESGRVLITKGKLAGVILLIHSLSRQQSGTPYKVTNLSSWYVEPEHRHLAPLMLRNLLRMENTMFTDLSPSASVIPMLGPLGFRPINAGLAAVALPTAALQPAHGGSVMGLEDVTPGALRDSTLSHLEFHMQFGALAAVLYVKGIYHPLLFVERTVRRLPTVQLLYCEDNFCFHRCISAVARFLLKKGKLLMLIDIPPNGTTPGVPFRGRGMKFAKGGFVENRTDYAGSEMLVLNSNSTGSIQ